MRYLVYGENQSHKIPVSDIKGAWVMTTWDMTNKDKKGRETVVLEMKDGTLKTVFASPNHEYLCRVQIAIDMYIKDTLVIEELKV